MSLASQLSFFYSSTGTVLLSSTATSTSTTTGALVVPGGVGISKDLYVGGTIYGTIDETSLSGILASTSTDAMNVLINNSVSATTYYVALTEQKDGNYSPLDADTNVYYDTETQTLTSTKFNTLGATNSTSTTTGDIVVAGGIGVGKDLYVGGTVTGGGIRSTTTSTPPPNPTVGDIWYLQGSDITYRYQYDGSNSYWVDITGPTASTSGTYINSGVNGSIIPSLNGAYDLGSATNRFRTLYVTSSTVDIGGVPISVSSGTLSVGGAQVITASTGTANTISVANTFGFKNRIINGDMRIDQRNAGASVTITTDEQFITDRWHFAPSANSKLTAQQSTTAPTGFNNSLLLTSSAATSVAAGDYYFLQHKIEGFNFADCGWGSASAQTITLSFWCRSSITGTYGGALVNSAQNRSYPFTYTISTANTFEYKTVTIAGDTSGTWIGATNGTGVRLRLGFGIGSTYSGTSGAWAASNYMSVTSATNWISTSGATFYITGVQLEKGSQATPFDTRDYGRELIMCQRYYQKSYDIETAAGTATRTGFINWNWGSMTSYATAYIVLPVRMRASPTVTNYNPDLTNTVGGRYWNGSSEVAFTGSLSGFAAYSSGFTFAMDATSRSNILFQWTASSEF